MTEREEILYRWLKNMSSRKIAESLGISRNTVRKIIKQAQSFGLQPSGDPQDLKRMMAPIFEDGPCSPPGAAQAFIGQFHEQIQTWREMPYMTVAQMVRLFKEQGQPVSETSLHRYLKTHFPSLPPSTIPLETSPGHQAQVDFGYMGLMTDPLSHKRRKAYAFIMILSHSRYRFVRFVFRQDVKTWIDCHIRAFHFFGGVPHTVMIDNLKSGIHQVDLYDPLVNRSYGELEKHYGFICDPTKVRTPRHKGKVERSVSVVRQQVLAGRTFQNIEAANVQALHWCRHEISRKVCRSTGQAPWDRFVSQEKACLLPLPADAYTCAQWQEGKVHRDHHVVFEGCFYSVPSQFIGHKIWIRACDRLVEIYLDHVRIKVHPRSFGKGIWCTDRTDYPSSAQAFLKQDKEQCLTKAQTLGTFSHKFMKHVLHRPSLVNQRKAQAILRLGDHYGAARFEEACRRALSFDNISYRCLKRILVQGIVSWNTPEPKRCLSHQASYLRNPQEFAALSLEDKR